MATKITELKAKITNMQTKKKEYEKEANTLKS